MRRRFLAVGCVLLVAGCSTAQHPSPGHLASGTRVPSSSNPGDSGTSTTSPTPATSSTPVTSGSQLPRGGRQIIGHYRVVADYGVAGSPALGVLGSGSPEDAAKAVIARAKGFAPYGLPVQPAMELIATVAQGSPGPDGDYSSPAPMAQLKRYLAVAHRYRMLLVLDLQPGRASFLSQAEHLHDLLLDPSVGLGLDPEWKVDSGAPGGGRIGSSDAADVNAVTAYVSKLVQAHELPDKLLVVHQFTLGMLRNRSQIGRPPGVEVTFHADGFGSRSVKRNVFRELGFPGHPYGTGFKLFLTQDSHIMQPAQVMALHPRPDVITYQ